MKTMQGRRGAGPKAASQRGVVAILVGLSMVVLIGFVGLALDGGHLYLTKTELQNGADACALAASYELTGAPNITEEAFKRAEAAGVSVAHENKVGFQKTALAASDITITFSTALEKAPWESADDPPDSQSRYVRCTIHRTGITPWFMQVLGFGDQTVSSMATATLAPSQTNCAVPMAMCAQPGGVAPHYGLEVGKWYDMSFSVKGSGGGNGGGNNDSGDDDEEGVTEIENYTGNFRWIDYNPGATSPNCSGNGAQELSCLLSSTGECSLPPPTNVASCSSGGNSNPTPGCVGQTGAINSLQTAYNSRFGLYKNGGGLNVSTAPPDFTGKAYSTENWTPGREAYGDFKAARSSNLPTTNEPGVTPKFIPNSYKASTSQEHQSHGADRRLVVVPIVECGSFAGSQHAPVRAYACILMLDPYRRTGNTVKSRLEYLGRSDQAGSPCATSGTPGGATSQGPLVPALVQ